VAYYTATIEINPAVRISVNKRDKVLEVYSLNEDAESLKLESWKGKSVESFLAGYLAACADNRFISQTRYAIVKLRIVGAKDNVDVNGKASEIESRIDKKLAELSVPHEIQTEAMGYGASYIKPDAGETVTVFFLADFGLGLTEYVAVAVRKGDIITAPRQDPMRERFEFEYWRSLSDYAEVADFFEWNDTSATVDIVLVAVWEAPLILLVDYDDDGDYDVFDKRYFRNGGYFYPTVNAPTREGHTFLYWSSTSGRDGSLTADYFADGPRPVSVGRTELYAVWSRP
jgi:hypothetical protein